MDILSMMTKILLGYEGQFLRFYLANPVEVNHEISEDDDEDLCKYIYFILL